MPSTAPLSPPAPITCLRCAYDVRGIPPDSQCPECGLAVARSLVPGDELRHAPAGWLASLSWGSRILFALYAGAILVARVVGTYVPDWVWFHTAVSAASGLLLAAGVWLLTRPQPRFDITTAPWRWSLRVVALAPLLQTVATYVVVQAPGRTGQVALNAFFVLNLLMLPLIAFPALLFLHLRRLARGVLNPRLAEHCAIVGVGGSVALTVALAPVVVPVRYPLVLDVSAAVLALLFYLWGTWLLLRFAIAFHRAHRASVAAWGAGG